MAIAYFHGSEESLFKFSLFARGNMKVSRRR